jgi:hypothetical protein
MAEAEPYFHSLAPPKPKLHDEAAASREASREEMAYLRALGRPRVAQPELPHIKASVLPKDFPEGVRALDEEIYSRGIAIDTDKLVELGKKRFAELLAADRKVPRSTIGAGIDTTRFSSVQTALNAFEASSVPKRKTSEVLSGLGKERDAVRKITGFDDLWKVTHERQEVITDIYAFRDLFASLVFGQSMLEKLSSDGRVRSRFFCCGKRRKVELFKQWVGVLQGSLTSVTLVQPLWHVVSWLSEEKTKPLSPIDLARDFFNLRSPSKEHVQLADAVLEGFLLDYTGWPLWEFVGRRTRTLPEVERLSVWRTALAQRYLGITSFQAEVRAAFFKDVGYSYDSHREFESAGHRYFVERTIQKLLAQLAAVLALATEASFPGTVVARFQGQVLCEGKPKQRAEITAHLAAAFPGATFPIAFEEGLSCVLR